MIWPCPTQWKPMEMFSSWHTFFMTIYGSLNIRWLSCIPMCHWLRDITLSSNVIKFHLFTCSGVQHALAILTMMPICSPWKVFIYLGDGWIKLSYKNLKSNFSMGSFHFQGEMRSNLSYPDSKLSQLSGSKFHFHGVVGRGRYSVQFTGYANRSLSGPEQLIRHLVNQDTRI